MRESFSSLHVQYASVFTMKSQSVQDVTTTFVWSAPNKWLPIVIYRKKLSSAHCVKCARHMTSQQISLRRKGKKKIQFSKIWMFKRIELRSITGIKLRLVHWYWVKTSSLSFSLRGTGLLDSKPVYSRRNTFKPRLTESMTQVEQLP